MTKFTGTIMAPPRGLSLAELGAEGAARIGNQRYVCPLCSPERRKAGRRDLSVDLATGAWQCWHCGEKGKLTDYWTDRPKLTVKERRAEKLRQVFNLTPKPKPAPVHDPDDALWRQWLRAAVPLAGTPGAAYLDGRGIPPEFAAAHGVTYITSWYGRPGIVYPLHDHVGLLAAVGVRYIDGPAEPKTRTGGRLGLGVFPTPGAFDGDTVVLVEGPADALALALCGIPAVALYRTSAPGWVVKRCAFKRVIVALDADTGGDEGAARLIPELDAYGATVKRLRPPLSKDWNDALIAWGTERLRAWLRETILPAPAPYRYEPVTCAVPNARCRFCRQPSHDGACLHPLDRPGALRQPGQAPESVDEDGNPYACPALAYGKACGSCARHLEHDAPAKGTVVVPVECSIDPFPAYQARIRSDWKPPSAPLRTCVDCGTRPPLPYHQRCQPCTLGQLSLRSTNA